VGVGDRVRGGDHLRGCRDVPTQELPTPLLHQRPQVNQAAATSFLTGAPLMD
jgi:hypothetical protein